MTESTPNEPFSLFNTSALLGDNRRVSALGSDDSRTDGWIVSVRHVAESWAEWRRHPDRDAFLFLLWGAAVVLTTDDIESPPVSHDLKAAGAFIVSAGTWCRVTVEEPANLLVAARAGTAETRPAN